jgi:hypothetical protein
MISRIVAPTVHLSLFDRGPIPPLHFIQVSVLSSGADLLSALRGGAPGRLHSAAALTS